MGVTVLRALGQIIRPLERIPVAGALVGIASRSTAYRLAESDNWPMVGPESSRWVLMIPLLERYGVPYTTGEYEHSDETETPAQLSLNAGSR